MICSDLDRYLEAFVDGQLSRSRTAVLHRHLERCPRCRARVEGLRQFEREMRDRFGPQEETRSLWGGLAADTARLAPTGAVDVITDSRAVRRAGPAASAGRGRDRSTAVIAGGQRRLSQIVGVLALALAAGAVWQLARDWLHPPPVLTALERAGPDADQAGKPAPTLAPAP